MGEYLKETQIEAINVPEISTTGTQQLGKMTILEALAEPAVFVSPNRSNRSTPPVNTDYDDQ